MVNSDAQSSDATVLDDPSLKLHRWLGVPKPDVASIARRVALVILTAWVPLALLSALANGGAPQMFFSDFAVHFKYLIALPCLVIADAVCAPRLSAFARNFFDAGLVTAADRPCFDAAIASTARLRESVVADVGALVLAYLIVALLFHSLSDYAASGWRGSETGSAFSLSPAGAWLLLVSLPLLLTLILNWMWRWSLWARFLWLMARLNLQLVPSHPDRAGGLRFAAYSISAFMPLGVALGALFAGDVANAVVHRSAPLLDYRYLVVEVVALSIVFFTAPLLVFSGQLLTAWRRGVFAYAALADRFGHQFERKWFGRNTPVDESVLERPDFSAATDLYQVVDRVNDMRLMPIDLRSVAMLAVATLLPFVPVVLMALPFDAILDRLGGLLL